MHALTKIYTRKNTSSVIARLLVVLVVLLVSTANADTDKDKVVLIAASGSGIKTIQLRDIRRLYLGYKSDDSQAVASPVLNVQSRELYDNFLKNIMHMTEGSYKRKLVKRIFRTGMEDIRELDSLKELNDHLQKNVGDISFVELASVENMQNVEVIQILW